MIFNNKKGIFFALDAILGLVILIIFLISASGFLSSNSSFIDDTSAVVLAKDIALVLIESGILESDLSVSDYTNTSLYLNNSIPIQFGSFVKITPESSSSFLIEGNPCTLESEFSYRFPFSSSSNYLVEVTIC